MKSLEFSAQEIRDSAALLGELMAGYEESLSDRPVFPQLDHQAIQSILSEPFPETGRSLSDLMAEFQDVVIPNSTHIGHPRFMAYVTSSPAGVAPFAEAVLYQDQPELHVCQLVGQARQGCGQEGGLVVDGDNDGELFCRHASRSLWQWLRRRRGAP